MKLHPASPMSSRRFLPESLQSADEGYQTGRALGPGDVHKQRSRLDTINLALFHLVGSLRTPVKQPLRVALL